ncbi:ABC transporter permease [Paenibacillus allorhizosphaerae]|uniref:Multiple-sugar transport system permease YteP n=1 Tax=Paenibacillus allorhizosphaerae TaxID=2849866 RepID=A0ABM8VP75_9BACL|nr:ABC transporter permease subunit [Paenibacillus allorhizosphaerae]CAG7652499.1 putative multiple-sugar transport system permease YteP [Paenibacillus allorhizosphaerae]
MQQTALEAKSAMAANPKRSKMLQRLRKDKYLFLLALPGLLYFLVYKYIPMLGTVIAFQEYSPFMGFAGSPWVGLKHFSTIFSEPEIIRVLWNTIVISFLQIAFAFPAPIVLALMLNEVRIEIYKRIIQTIVYMPHFLSWVVVVGIFVIFMRGEGLINNFLEVVFGIDKPVPFLTDQSLFRPLIIMQVLWKEVGWGTILFLAALAGINPDLYEASVMDGAGRWRRIWHISLPGIRSTIVILLILRLGHVLDSGFEHIFLMQNSFNKEISNVLDTYVYYKGIEQSNYSFATAVGLFKGIVGLVLVAGANKLAKRFGEEGVY